LRIGVINAVKEPLNITSPGVRSPSSCINGETPGAAAGSRALDNRGTIQTPLRHRKPADPVSGGSRDKDRGKAATPCLRKTVLAFDVPFCGACAVVGALAL
jgi:hypothetical protein